MGDGVCFLQSASGRRFLPPATSHHLLSLGLIRLTDFPAPSLSLFFFVLHHFWRHPLYKRCASTAQFRPCTGTSSRKVCMASRYQRKLILKKPMMLTSRLGFVSPM